MLKRQVKWQIISVIVLIFTLLLYNGCKRESDDVPTTFTHVANEVELGWNEYLNENYAAAIENFEIATNRDAMYTEAYNGIGWSYLKLQNFEQATSNFDFAIYLGGESGDINQLADAYAGMCVLNSFQRILSEMGDEEVDQEILNTYSESAISFGNNTLNTWPGYSTSHDPEFDALKVNVIIAQSYLLINEFADALQEVYKIEPAFQNDINTQFAPQTITDTLATSRNDAGLYFLTTTSGAIAVNDLIEMVTNSPENFILRGSGTIELSDDNFYVQTDTLVSHWDILHENVILETSKGPVIEVESLIDTVTQQLEVSSLLPDKPQQIKLDDRTLAEDIDDVFIIRYKYGKTYHVDYEIVENYSDFLYTLMEKIRTLNL